MCDKVGTRTLLRAGPDLFRYFFLNKRDSKSLLGSLPLDALLAEDTGLSAQALAPSGARAYASPDLILKAESGTGRLYCSSEQLESRGGGGAAPQAQPEVLLGLH